MFTKVAKKIILASSSHSRMRMLEAAGIDATVVPSNVDEGVIIDGLAEGDLTPSDIAELLARTKAEAVSANFGAACVIGGDQILSLDGKIFTKPGNLDEARDALFKLRGRTHMLHSAVAVAEDGLTRWAYVETAHMTMRNFSAEFLGAYLGTVGEEICRSVGVYEIEGLGVHLFNDIDGDHFTIRGMPMISLLNFLYDDGVLGR